ncbi:hypothetical protein L208DRAFT_1401444 [Tricholoma matsutake]|nr:hypothetical protein L208DRAFT_1401417 [Tricholoma matsutake 945]KAF8229865.1 hypothetical protein L208DRAFT_1401444 [Tricholoma matsutake 945]
MKHWGSLDITAGIEIAINDLGNSMLLGLDDHIMFRSFMWYLEPMENERNTYTVQTIPGIDIPIKGNRVAFADKSGRGIPLPDPRFLALHAAFAKVLHSSGVGKYFFQSEEKEVEIVTGKHGAPNFGSLLYRSSTL